MSHPSSSTAPRHPRQPLVSVGHRSYSLADTSLSASLGRLFGSQGGQVGGLLPCISYISHHHPQACWPIREPRLVRWGTLSPTVRHPVPHPSSPASLAYAHRSRSRRPGTWVARQTLPRSRDTRDGASRGPACMSRLPCLLLHCEGRTKASAGHGWRACPGLPAITRPQPLIPSLPLAGDRARPLIGPVRDKQELAQTHT